MQTIRNQNFDKYMEMLLLHEGGFVNHSSDPGGMTNPDVTKKTYDHHYGKDIDKQVLRSLTVEDVMSIYKTNYGERCRFQDLTSCVDWAVNSGPGRSIKALQRAIGVFEDGIIAAQTLMCMKNEEPAQISKRMSAHRDSFYRWLSTFDKFEREWLRRNDENRT